MYGLLIANVLIYVIQALGILNLTNWSMIPYSVIHNVRVAPVANNFGQIVGFAKTPGVGLDPQWLTIFTSMFMHGSIMHLGGNMLYLWIFGNNIEDVLGHAKFFVFYIVCGVLAALAHIAFSLGSPIPTVGASGAIAGVLGAYLLLFPNARIRTLVFIFFFVTFVEIPALIVLGFWFVLQLTGVLGPSMPGGGIAYWAHVGGFVAGMLIIHIAGGKTLLRRRRTYQSPYDEDRPYPFRPWR